MTFWPWLILVTAYGACVGSFLNVVCYRMPAGKSIVTPPSSCPRCGNRLAWYDNVPVLAWLWLRGRCRYCKAPISPQYPIMEALCAIFFAGLFLAYYVTGGREVFKVLTFEHTWPVLVVHLILLGGLIASTKIDADYFIIPLEIPWTVTLVALVALPVTAIFMPTLASIVPRPALAPMPPWCPVLPTAPIWGMGASLGGVLGLGVALLLLKRGILPYSFDEQKLADQKPAPAAKPPKLKDKLKKRKKKRGGGVGPSPGPVNAEQPTPPANPRRLYLYLAVVAVAVVVSAFFGPIGMFIAFALLWWGVLIVNVGAYGEPMEEMGPEHWAVFEHPRMEALKECLFLMFPVVGAAIGAAVAAIPAVSSSLAGAAPFWKVLAGAAFGYLAGGGLVWGVRVLGTLGFGKEAMGLGDVHLVAAIGAVLGWMDAGLTFFMAAFAGLGYAIVAASLGRFLFKRGAQIPFGPHLCGAAVIIMAFHSRVEYYIWVLFGISC